jgi:GNAT superfamily N-acetyltransferase
MADLQRVLEGAPQYAELVTGAPPGPADAQSTYSGLPEGKSYEDKFVFGICCGADMVGCADLIRGYPDRHTAWLGLLLVAKAFERRGFGSAAYRELEAVVRSWGCKRIRLSVVRANAQALPFWRKLGFAPTGETKPYRYGAVVSEHILLEKRLY